MNPKILTPLLCAVLAACGGGGDAVEPVAVAASQPAAASAPQPVKAQCRDVKVNLYGDSTMQGSQHFTLDANGRSALGRYLDANSTRHVLITDLSIPGTTSTLMVIGWDGTQVGPAWPHWLDADVIVVNHGLNDAARVDGATYEANLRIIASAGVPTVFQTPNPIPDLGQDPKGYAAIMRTVALETHNALADVYSYVIALPNWLPMIWDGAHPDYDLYLKLASDVVGPALLPLVEAVPCN